MVAEHRLTLARVGHACKLLWESDHPSVWALACQTHIPGGHAGFGLTSMRSAPISVPTFLLNFLMICIGQVEHCFVCCVFLMEEEVVVGGEGREEVHMFFFVGIGALARLAGLLMGD